VDFDVLMGRVAGRFAWVEPRRRAAAFVAGPLAQLPRTNCWTIAEDAGDDNPDGMQRLLARDVWDAEAVRGDLRGYVTEYLSDDDAVLIVDEAGDLNKGVRTVGGAAAVHWHRGPDRERPNGNHAPSHALIRGYPGIGPGR
jgi:SRSO17 transposase